MIKPPPRITRTDTRLPYTTTFRAKAWRWSWHWLSALGAALASGLLAVAPISRAIGQCRKDMPRLHNCYPAPIDRDIGGNSLQRSAEPTSELQSLLRISYSVFCLTQYTHTKQYTNKTKSPHNN